MTLRRCSISPAWAASASRTRLQLRAVEDVWRNLRATRYCRTSGPRDAGAHGSQAPARPRADRCNAEFTGEAARRALHGSRVSQSARIRASGYKRITAYSEAGNVQYEESLQAAQRERRLVGRLLGKQSED